MCQPDYFVTNLQCFVCMYWQLGTYFIYVSVQFAAVSFQKMSIWMRMMLVAHSSLYYAVQILSFWYKVIMKITPGGRECKMIIALNV